jgi:hypothetical protein
MTQERGTSCHPLSWAAAGVDTRKMDNELSSQYDAESLFDAVDKFIWDWCKLSD